MSQPHPRGSVNDDGSSPARFGIPCELPEIAVPGLNRPLDRMLTWADSSDLLRGWFFLVMLVGSVAFTWRPGCNEARALLGASVLNEMSIALLGISATYRFSWFLAVAAQLTAALALRRSRRFGLSNDDGGGADDHEDDSSEDEPLVEPLPSTQQPVARTVRSR